MRLRRREAGDDRAVAADIVDIGDALAAAAGTAIFIGRRQLAIAIGADGEDERVAPRKLRETIVEIGRAAWRERVGPYVETSRGAVTYKQKKKTTNTLNKNL